MEEFFKRALATRKAQEELDEALAILQWVANNYRATLAGKSVRNVDECLCATDSILKRHGLIR